MNRPSLEVVILSGLSGSGKSSALHTLEDAGYFAIDNLPGELLPPLLELLKRGSGFGSRRRIAVVMDAREPAFLKNFAGYLRLLRSRRIRFRILFLDARDDILLRRFSETRRRHPLAPHDRVPVGIARERDLLHPVRAVSHHLIDTSYLNVHELREKLLSLLHREKRKKDLSVTVVSFGYRYGLPLEADLILDLRFLPNPHFVDALRPLSGRNPRVARFVLQKKETRRFLKSLKVLLSLLLRQSLKEGKAYLTLGLGCTGGRHRSVALAEQVARDLKLLGYPVKIRHRDISRGE
jgi:UPF0042 nucleotide-binding protein